MLVNSFVKKIEKNTTNEQTDTRRASELTSTRTASISAGHSAAGSATMAGWCLLTARTSDKLAEL